MDSLLLLLPKDLPWLVSEMSWNCQGIFSIPISGNPVYSNYTVTVESQRLCRIYKKKLITKLITVRVHFISFFCRHSAIPIYHLTTGMLNGCTWGNVCKLICTLDDFKVMYMYFPFPDPKPKENKNFKMRVKLGHL